MEYFINYLLESSLILGLLAIFYKVVLHQEALFKFNRIYLLVSLLLATIVPFFHIVLYQAKAVDTQQVGFVNLIDAVNVFAEGVRQTVVPVMAQSKTFGWLYLVGALGVLLRLLFGLVRLGVLSKNANWIKHKGVSIVDLPGRFNAFSFFHVIFVNRSLYSDDDLDKIVVHELAHVKHRHSLDVLLFEFLLIVQWFNPFAWLIKHLLKELHEFQADCSVLKEGTPIGSYKKLLLYQAAGLRLLPVNNFNQSITKKRFKMMTNETIKNKALAKVGAAILLMFVVGVFFACENSSEEQLKQGDLKNGEIETVYEVVDIMPQFPGGMEELKLYVKNNVKYPIDAQEQGKSGKVFVQFVVSKTGLVKDVKVLRGAGFNSLDEEALRVVRSMPKWTPGLLKGEHVNVRFTLPINFALGDKKQTN